MIITCKICQKSFEWHRKGGGRQPTICLDPKCYKIRDKLQYQKWKATHNYTRYEKRKPTIKLQSNVYKKKRCTNILTDDNGKKYRCNKITANGGRNKYYCQACWDRLSEGVSQEHSAFIYDQSYSENIECS